MTVRRGGRGGRGCKENGEGGQTSRGHRVQRAAGGATVPTKMHPPQGAGWKGREHPHWRPRRQTKSPPPPLPTVAGGRAAEWAAGGRARRWAGTGDGRTAVPARGGGRAPQAPRRWPVQRWSGTPRGSPPADPPPPSRGCPLGAAPRWKGWWGGAPGVVCAGGVGTDCMVPIRVGHERIVQQLYCFSSHHRLHSILGRGQAVGPMRGALRASISDYGACMDEGTHRTKRTRDRCELCNRERGGARWSCMEWPMPRSSRGWRMAEDEPGDWGEGRPRAATLSTLVSLI